MTGEYNDEGAGPGEITDTEIDQEPGPEPEEVDPEEIPDADT